MYDKKRAISIIMIFFIMVFSLLTNKVTAYQDVHKSYIWNDKAIKEFKIGSELGRDLALGCSIFIGTVQTISELKEDKLKKQLYSQIDMSVNQWLWGEEENQDSTITIYKPAIPRSPIENGPWSIWDNVQLQVGQELLVVLWADNMKKQKQHQGKGSEIATIISNQFFFQDIQETINQHSLYKQNPKDEDFKELLTIKQKPIFNGYLVGYLEKELFLTNKQISILIYLLGSAQVPENAWVTITRTLTRAVLRDYHPLPETTYKAIVETLIHTGTGTNTQLAKNAIDALTVLANNKLNIEQFLNTNNCNKLNQNYYIIFGDNPSLDEEHKEFKSKLHRIMHSDNKN